MVHCVKSPRSSLPPSPIGADVTQVDWDVPEAWPPIVEEDGFAIPLHAEELDE